MVPLESPELIERYSVNAAVYETDIDGLFVTVETEASHEVSLAMRIGRGSDVAVSAFASEIAGYGVAAERLGPDPHRIAYERDAALGVRVFLVVVPRGEIDAVDRVVGQEPEV